MEVASCHQCGIYLKRYAIALLFIINMPVNCKPLEDKDARIITNEFNLEAPDSYQFKFETSNGIAAAEIGEFERTGFQKGILVKKGYYTYLGPDNIQYTVTYVADENGFRPKLHRSYKKEGRPDDLPLPGEKSASVTDVDDDRIGDTLLISLGGGGLG